MNRILFVCTGNTCRSPMAEGIFRKLLQEHGLDHIEVRSAGVAASDGSPVSRNAAQILKEQGHSGSGDMTSSALSVQLIVWADVVLTMTNGHKQHAATRFPEHVDKMFTLKEFVEDDTGVLERIAELEDLVADLQLKQALGQPITTEDRAKWRDLERQLPEYDIADPFGGPLSLYRECAGEIEVALHKLIRKLKP